MSLYVNVYMHLKCKLQEHPITDAVVTVH